jgi:hypothetical protein
MMPFQIKHILELYNKETCELNLSEKCILDEDLKNIIEFLNAN